VPGDIRSAGSTPTAISNFPPFHRTPTIIQTPVTLFLLFFVFAAVSG
jgi:hypothetical protein